MVTAHSPLSPCSSAPSPLVHLDPKARAPHGLARTFRNHRSPLTVVNASRKIMQFPTIAGSTRAFVSLSFTVKPSPPLPPNSSRSPPALLSGTSSTSCAPVGIKNRSRRLPFSVIRMAPSLSRSSLFCSALLMLLQLNWRHVRTRLFTHLTWDGGLGSRRQ